MHIHFLGRNIRYLRKQQNKTQFDLSLVFGKGQTTIGNWENGLSEPGIGELLLLSNYFDISVDILLKVDLSLTNWQSELRKEQGLLSGPSTPIPYDHTPPETIAQDQPGRGLTYVLEEIKAIRAEIRAIRSRLPPALPDTEKPV